MKEISKREKGEGPEYEVFLKIAFGGEDHATSFAFEAGRFPDLVTKLEDLVAEFKTRGVEMVEGRPLSGVV